MIRSRSPEPPFCWQSKTTRRRIREMMNGHESTASLLSLYDALTEEASNQGSEVFTAGQPYLGQLAGISGKTVHRLEPLLEEFGVVQITRPKMRGFHTYLLLSLETPCPNVRTSSFSGCPPVEEHKKNIRKNSRSRDSERERADGRFPVRQAARFRLIIKRSTQEAAEAAGVTKGYVRQAAKAGGSAKTVTRKIGRADANT